MAFLVKNSIQAETKSSIQAGATLLATPLQRMNLEEHRMPTCKIQTPSAPMERASQISKKKFPLEMARTKKTSGIGTRTRVVRKLGPDEYLEPKWLRYLCIS